jgi:hypothetical protein
LTRRRQGAAGAPCLHDFLRRQREEEHHADVVDDEFERVRHLAVLGRRGVGPQQRDDRSRDEQQGAIDDVEPVVAKPRHLSPRAAAR